MTISIQRIWFQDRVKIICNNITVYFVVTYLICLVEIQYTNIQDLDNVHTNLIKRISFILTGCKRSQSINTSTNEIPIQQHSRWKTVQKNGKTFRFSQFFLEFMKNTFFPIPFELLKDFTNDRDWNMEHYYICAVVTNQCTILETDGLRPFYDKLWYIWKRTARLYYLSYMI